MRRWRVGIAGLGHWYSAFGLARAMPEYPRAELVAVAWHDARQRDTFASTFGIDAHESYDELIARPDVDIVQIAAPVAEIPELTIKAAAAGKHLVVGKPIAMTLEQADAMVEAVERAGVTCVGFQGLMRLGASGSSAASAPARSVRSLSSTRRAAGRSRRTGTDPRSRAGSPTLASCPAAR